MDNSNQTENILDLKKCPHSRLIMATIDLDHESHEMIWFEKHRKECPHCESEFKKLRYRMFKVGQMIPEPVLNRPQQEQYEHEVDEIFKKVPLKENKENLLLQFVGKLRRVLHFKA